jgi:hypothetical protein
MAQYFQGLYSHQTCHPLSMCGMLWIDVYDSVIQFPPISSNFAQPLKRSGTTFRGPQSTAWSTLCEGDVSCYMRQMVVTPDTDWFLNHTPTLRYLWPTDAYVYSLPCEICRLGPNLFISIDWFPYMNWNSVKSLKLLHVVFIFLFSVYTVPVKD